MQPHVYQIRMMKRRHFWAVDRRRSYKRDFVSSQLDMYSYYTNVEAPSHFLWRLNFNYCYGGEA